MNNIYKHCIYCGEQLYRGETRCRYCRRWQNRFNDRYDDSRNDRCGDPYEDNYQRFDNNADDQRNPYARYDRYGNRSCCDSPSHNPYYDRNAYYPCPESPRMPLSGFEIGAIMIIVVLLGLIIGLLLC